MYGLVGKMLVVDGKRNEVVEAMLSGLAEMPGCLSYVVALDKADESGIWITEVWESKEAHAASLELPAVRETIAGVRHLITGFGERYETEPRGGLGLGT